MNKIRYGTLLVGLILFFIPTSNIWGKAHHCDGMNYLGIKLISTPLFESEEKLYRLNPNDQTESNSILFSLSNMELMSSGRWGSDRTEIRKFSAELRVGFSFNGETDWKYLTLSELGHPSDKITVSPNCYCYTLRAGDPNEIPTSLNVSIKNLYNLLGKDNISCFQRIYYKLEYKAEASYERKATDKYYPGNGKYASTVANYFYIQDMSKNVVGVYPERNPNIGTEDSPLYAMYMDYDYYDAKQTEVRLKNVSGRCIPNSDKKEGYTSTVSIDGSAVRTLTPRNLTNGDLVEDLNYLKLVLDRNCVKKFDLRQRLCIKSNKDAIASVTYSNRLNFQTFPKVKIDGLRKNDDPQTRYYCKGDDYLEVKGNPIKADKADGCSKGEDFDIDVYRPEYMWQYRYEGDGAWRDFSESDTLKSSDGTAKVMFDGCNLRIHKSFIYGKIYFRQKVKLGLFPLITVYADGDNYVSSTQMGDESTYVSYTLYNPIHKSNFTITEDEPICKGTEFDIWRGKGAVNVSFKPTEGRHYASIDETMELDEDGYNDFDYQWIRKTTLGSDTMSEKGSAVYCKSEVNEDVTFIATITDGCHNQVTLSSRKVVHDSPVLGVDAIQTTNGSIQRGEGKLSIEGIQGEKVSIEIDDENKEKYNYYLFFPKGDSEMDSIPLKTIRYTSIDMDKLAAVAAEGATYIVKKDLTPLGCESAHLPVSIMVQGVISNLIEIEKPTDTGSNNPKKEVYVCLDDSSPAIRGFDAKGGFSNGKYKYIWEITTDTTTGSWSQLVALGMTSPHLPKGTFFVHEKMFVRRRVVSYTENAEVESPGKIIEIRPYTMPSVTVEASVGVEPYDSHLSVWNVCYNDNIWMRIKSNIDSLKEGLGIEKEEFVFYNDKDKKEEPIFSPSYVITKSRYLKARAHFCHKTIESSNKISIVVGENLEPVSSKNKTKGCYLEGNTIDLNIQTMLNEPYDYEIETNMGKWRGENAKIKFEDTEDHHYSVTKKLGTCSATKTFTIYGTTILAKLKQSDMMVIGSNVAKESDGKYLVCKGDQFEIRDNQTTDMVNIVYEWSMVDKFGLRTTVGTNRFLTYSLSKGGESCQFIRTRKYINECDVVYDTVNVGTHPEISVSGFAAPSEPVICYGENVVLKYDEKNIKGGTGNGFTFEWKTTPNGAVGTEIATIGTGSRFELTNMKETSNYSLFATDNVCPSYSVYVNSLQVEVVKDLTIKREDITISPASFSLDVFESSSQQLVEVVDKGAFPLRAKVSFLHDDDTLIMKNATALTSYKYSISKDMALSSGGVISYSVVRSITNDAKTCMSQPYVGDVTIEQGFEGEFGIKADNQYNDSVRLCSGNSVVLDFDNLPRYDGNEIDANDKNVSFQWKRRKSDSSKWSYINGEKGQDMTVVPSAQDYYYACELAYVNTSGVKVRYTSNSILVYGYKKQTPGIVEGAESYSLCRNDVKEVRLTYKGSAGIEGAYRWQMSTDNKTWSNILEDENVVGTKTRNLTYKTMFHKTTLFRCMAVDMCEDTTYSTNVVRVAVNEGSVILAEDIHLLTNPIISHGDSLRKVTIGAPTDGKHTYYWYYNDAKVMVGETKNVVTFNRTDDYVPNKTVGDVRSFYESGRHTLNVYKVSDDGCYSDTIQYEYRLFDELRAYPVVLEPENLFFDTVVCKGVNMTKRLLNIAVSGGDTEEPYELDWYYKTKSMNDFALLGGDNVPFSYEFEEGDIFHAHGFRMYILGPFNETTSFYGLAKSKNYPGPSARSRNSTLTLFDDLDAGDIEFTESEVCDGGLPFIREIREAKNGNAGKTGYTYTWIRSEEGPDGPWETVKGVSGKDFHPTNDDYRMHKNTFFRRVVRDGCRTTDTTETYKLFNVSDVVTLGPDEVYGSTVVDNGSPAVFLGRDDASQYIFFDETGYVALDTIAGGLNDRFTSKELKNDASFFARKMNAMGCLSKNDTLLNVSVKKPLKGGEIAWADFNGPAWVCSGLVAGKIEDLEEPFGDCLTFSWEYSTTENGTYIPVKGVSGAEVVSQTIDLDTCSLNLINNEGKEKAFFIRRITNSSYFSYELNKMIIRTVESNKLKINVVPTLSSLEELVIDNLAGKLGVDKKIYCYGEESEIIELEVPSVVEESWFSEDLGASKYGNTLTWSWEIAKGIYNTTTTAKNAEWKPVRSGDFLLNLYPKQYALGEVVDSTTVRFSISDGCSSLSTNPVPQVVSSLGKIQDSLFVITPSYVEEGDNIRITYTDPSYFENWHWFADKEAKDTLSNKNGLTLTNVSMTTSAYLQLGDGVCETDVRQVPLTVYPKSEGGQISSSQQVCIGGEFDDIVSNRHAKGGTGVFAYEWQYSTTPSNELTWKKVEEELEADLPASAINKIMDGENTYFRRVATNEFGRKSYSDTILLSYFDELTPGTLSFEKDSKKEKFCQYESLPDIVTSMPSGGKSDSYGYGYKIGWEISLDNDNYTVVSEPSMTVGTKFRTEDGIRKISYNMEEDNVFYVRARYVDESCGEAYSQPFSFTVYRTSEIPVVHQEKQTCESDSVIIMVENVTDYTYRWFVMDEGQQTWEETGIVSKKLRRNSEANQSLYGIQASMIETGCRSEIFYFNLDSLPILTQPSLQEEYVACYDSDFTLQAKVATGGAGSRSYQWQYSYDNTEWTDDVQNTDVNYTQQHLKKTVYLRRIVSDLCDEHIGKSVKVLVTDKPSERLSVELLKKSCPDGFIQVSFYRNSQMQNSDDFTFNERFIMYDEQKFDYDNYKAYSDDPLSEDSGMEYYDNLGGGWDSLKASIEGFPEKSKDFIIVNSVVAKHDKTTLYCFSNDTIHVRIENVTPLSIVDSSYNRIASSNDKYSICNGKEIEVEQRPMVEPRWSDDFSYRWEYTTQNPNQLDNLNWKEMNAVDLMHANMIITDTTYIRRVISNGCESLISNVLTINEKNSSELDYAKRYNLCVTTNVSTSVDEETKVKETKSNVHLFAEAIKYLIEVDAQGGYKKDVDQENFDFPFSAETYKDSSIYVVENDDYECYQPMRINPLYGGVLYMDGNGHICAGTPVPPIKCTEVNGGLGSYEYQWQYKNEYVAEFVNIDGATSTDYTPEPVRVKTMYRRVVKSGFYVMFSNEIEVEIFNTPSVGRIVAEQPASYFENQGLNYTENSVQRTPNMEVNLMVSAHGATTTIWQRSNDKKEWTDMSYDDLEGETSRYTVNDGDSISYYRVIADNGCKVDTSRLFVVYSLSEPVILESEFDIVYPSKGCLSKWVSISMHDTLHYSYKYEFDTSLVKKNFEMVVRVPNNSHGSYVYSDLIEDPIDTYYPAYRSGKMTKNKIQFIVLLDSFDVKITRVDDRSGVESSRTVRIGTKRMDVDFFMMIDGNRYTSSVENVDIEQGARVTFEPTVEVEQVNYLKWNLIEAPNRDLGGTQGLVSNKWNPACYFYNAGRYAITLELTDIRGCTRKIVSTTLNLPKESVRKTHIGAGAYFAEDEDESLDIMSDVQVYPTLVDDELHIVSKGETRSLTIYNEMGMVVLSGEVEEMMDVRTDEWPKGIYLVRVGDWSYTVLKK